MSIAVISFLSYIFIYFTVKVLPDLLLLLVMRQYTHDIFSMVLPIILVCAPVNFKYNK